ncbi:SRPBCC family protein [Roseicella frigidaeris]|uniref:SRPBCC family protein n=1 Tax=Roseicella frigidaeris TaxID=2230885 RepID=A0A327MAA1_9PROT|nr:SRPBCC family protein [Roseicella frigidaeris]RAI59860.1 hypothetical protein DOO78_06310 [Roseicella frigidaeris]
MGDYAGRVEIARPAAEVFAFLADIRNMPRYLPTVTRVDPQGRHGDHDDVAVEGRAEDHGYHDEGWLKAEPEARRMQWGSHGQHGYGGSLEVTAAEGGSVVALQLHLASKPGAAAHGPGDAEMQAALQRTLASIKACCEAPGGAAAQETGQGTDELPDSRPFGSSATMNPDL